MMKKSAILINRVLLNIIMTELCVYLENELTKVYFGLFICNIIIGWISTLRHCESGLCDDSRMLHWIKETADYIAKGM